MSAHVAWWAAGVDRIHLVEVGRVAAPLATLCFVDGLWCWYDGPCEHCISRDIDDARVYVVDEMRERHPWLQIVVVNP